MGNWYTYTVWAMAALNLATGIGCLVDGKLPHAGMFICYAVACVCIVYQVK